MKQSESRTHCRSAHWRSRYLLTAAVAMAPVVALAHAVLLESSPPQNGSLPAAAATQATLRFNARIEKRVVRVKLWDAAGHEVKLPALPEDKDGPVDRLLVSLPALAPGAYSLEYDVLATDGHLTPGLLQFTVTAAPATSPTTRPATEAPRSGNK